MRAVGTIVAAASLTLVASACASDDQTATTTTVPSVEIVRDVQYAPGLRADLYLPDAPSDRPTIVWLHGGGFIGGDKAQLAGLATDFARRGYPGMAIQYRLSEGGPWFPTASLDDPDLTAAASKVVEDTDRAVSWLGSEDAKLRGADAQNVVLAGYSAGGIAAVSAAANGTTPAIDGAVGIAGAAIDPAKLNGTTPPLLLLHGNLDDVIPVTLAQQTCAAAAQQEADCTLETIDGAGHGLPFDNPTAVTESIQAFLMGLA